MGNARSTSKETQGNEVPEDFLTPRQRQTIVANILSDVALRILKTTHEDEIA